MIYAVFTDRGDKHKLGKYFFDHIQLPYRFNTSDTIALLNAKGWNNFYCIDPDVPGVQLVSFKSVQEFSDYMIRVFKQYRDDYSSVDTIRDTMNDIIFDVTSGSYSIDEFVDLYNQNIVPDGLVVLNTVESLVTYMSR